MNANLIQAGQRVITSHGETVTVAFVALGCVWAYGSRGLPRRVVVRTDAFGGEHDLRLGLAA